MAQYGKFDEHDELLATQTVDMAECIYEAFIDELTDMTLKDDCYGIAHAGERFAHWVDVLETLEYSGVITSEDVRIAKKSMSCDLKQWVLNGGDWDAPDED